MVIIARRGCSVVVTRLLPKQKITGSSPVTRFVMNWLKRLLGSEPTGSESEPSPTQVSSQPTSTTDSGDASVITRRVLVLIHNPIIEQEGGRKLNQVMGWNDPDQLAQQYIRDVGEASWGRVRYEIAERVEIDGFPTKVDGFAYTDASYLQAWRSRSGFHQPDAVFYPELLQRVNFIHKLEAGLVDELWLFAFPYAGYFESCMGGRGAIWCNGTIIPGTERASRKFVVMGFNYERGVGEMLEDLGHRAENIMAHVFQRVPPQANLWQRFIQYDKTDPGRAACGNVHFAPNSRSDYDWGHTRTVLSTADDWLSYPNLTGQARPMTCADWGRGDIRLHHIWWMQRFPHVAGSNEYGIAHNWWRYIVGLEF